MCKKCQKFFSIIILLLSDLASEPFLLSHFSHCFLVEVDVPATSYGYLELTHDQQTNDIFSESENAYEVIANNEPVHSDELQYQRIKTESEIDSASCRSLEINDSSEVDRLVLNQPEADENVENQLEHEEITTKDYKAQTSDIGSPQDDFSEETRNSGANASSEVDQLILNQTEAEVNLKSRVEYEDTIVNLVAQTSDGGSLQNDFAEETRNFKTNQLLEVGQHVSNQLKAEENAESRSEYEDTILKLVAHTSNVGPTQNELAKKNDSAISSKKTDGKYHKKYGKSFNNTLTANTEETADEINTKNHKEDNKYSHKQMEENSDELKENSYEIAYSDFGHLFLSKKYSQNKGDCETAKNAKFGGDNNEPITERSSMNENNYETAYADIRRGKNVEPPTMNIDNAA